MNLPTYKSELLNEFYPNVEAFFNNKQKKNNVLLGINKYIDKNSEVLNYIAPTKRLIFSKDGYDANLIFDALDIEPIQIKNVVKKINSINKVADVIKEPIFISLALMLRYANENKLDKEKDVLLMYLTLAFYSSIQYRSFKFEPNENVVQYTINRISNKYYFKQYGTVFKSLYVTADTLNTTSKPKLLSDSDKDIVDYLMFLRSRISNMVVKFAQELYKDIESGNYLNTTEDIYGDDNFREITNVSGHIANVATRSSLNFFQSRIDQRIVNMSARLSSVTPSVLYNTMVAIKDSERERVEIIIRNILVLYLKDPDNSIESIGSQKFINYSLKIYAKSNTKDPQVIYIKDALNYFLEHYCDKYNQTDREATKINYRKAVFSYFILLIANNS